MLFFHIEVLQNFLNFENFENLIKSVFPKTDIFILLKSVFEETGIFCAFTFLLEKGF